MKSWEWGSNCFWRKQRCSLIGFWWYGSTIENEPEWRKPEESSGDQHTTLTRLDSISPDHSFLFQTLLIISADLLLSSFPYSLDSQSWLNKCTVFNTLLDSTHCCTTHRFSSTHVIWLHIPVLIFTEPSTVSCWRLIGGSDWCSPPAAHEEFSHGSGFLNTAALKIHLSHTSHCPSNHDDNAFQHITI